VKQATSYNLQLTQRWIQVICTSQLQSSVRGSILFVKVHGKNYVNFAVVQLN